MAGSWGAAASLWISSWDLTQQKKNISHSRLVTVTLKTLHISLQALDSLTALTDNNHVIWSCSASDLKRTVTDAGVKRAELKDDDDEIC